MLNVRRFLLTLVLTLCATAAAFAQNESIIVEAESGVVGAQFQIANDGAIQYASIVGTVGGQNPTTADRTISFSVTFPSAGTYELYARLRVGPATFNDDSMYYGTGFGAKSPTADGDWTLANGLAAPVGYTLAADKVVGGGAAQSNVWKWVKLSAFDGGEPPVAGFVVPAAALVQTFQVAGREDGLWLDKFAFGRQGVFFTVFDLDNGLPGTTVPPPPPYVPPGPPIAHRQAEVPGRRLEPVAGPELQGVLEPGDGRERRQVGQRRGDARRHELGGPRPRVRARAERTASRSACTRSSGATSSRRGWSRCRPRSSWRRSTSGSPRSRSATSTSTSSTS